eukprot:CAMPEP_0206385334 /NCGR_PEP_ID=MMETSP0294-20121207/15195_1 /ASSEMBLY_ACC=CAM_ASM_000327 /TAXON_ID=39354 /ORGANISM="Heterosigma akashiwo, Strain CCMP2393" /LENGTH=62 /DNA_ID=CAMNT_0053835989 /DNA_START=748 /DNA_END=936 /DNA_ORIENTATION=-
MVKSCRIRIRAHSPAHLLRNPQPQGLADWVYDRPGGTAPADASLLLCGGSGVPRDKRRPTRR